VEGTMKHLSVFIALLFFTMVSSASILDFQTDFTKATGLCLKPKISGKITKLNRYYPETQITPELKFFNYGVIFARCGIVFFKQEKDRYKEKDRYAKLTLDIKGVVGKTIYDKFLNIIDKLELTVGYGKTDKLFLEFCLEI
jgi:hypothetical protein